MTLKTLYYSGIRFANFELNAAKEKLEIVKSRGGAAPLKTAKEPGEKHRLEPYLNFGGENFW